MMIKSKSNYLSLNSNQNKADKFKRLDANFKAVPRFVASFTKEYAVLLN